MVAVAIKKKRVVIYEDEAMAAVQAVRIAVDVSDPPDSVLESLGCFVDRMMRAFDMEVCGECGRLCSPEQQCDSLSDCSG